MPNDRILDSMKRGNVVLVDCEDQPVGEMEKLLAHKRGVLHRAFSVFIFNSEGQVLLQKRASHKYHGADLWTNACCSHPQWNENVRDSAMERLWHEMGINCDLTFVYSFIYDEPVENNLTEHELDHVFVGYTDQQPSINPDEVKEYKWASIAQTLEDIQVNAKNYTIWFRQALPMLLSKI